MSSGSFYEYYDQILDLIACRDWNESEKVAELFSCDGPHVSNHNLYVLNLEDEYPDRKVEDEVFDDLVALHLRVLYYLSKNEYHDAFNAQKALLQYFHKEILSEEKDANWFIPILFALCKDLRVIASMADKAREIIDEDEKSFYEEAANPIMECYRVCVADGRNAFEISKKVAILNLTNQLFRIYYRINRLPLLKPLVRAIDVSKDSELYSLFSKADKVIYNYYVGRKAIFDNNLELAEESLSYAFKNCPQNCSSNKKLILLYLIPVKMFLGVVPTQQLLETYDLSCFKQLVDAVKDGNLKLFETSLKSQETFFIDSGIFLMLEKLKLTTFLNLIRTISNVLDTHQVRLDAIRAALTGLEYEMDNEEISCILANVIMQKKIKGYISYNHQTVVLSKKDAFP
ncbi:UNVERIFIED_CONTAM: hypothetical protein FQV16_0000891, partial [Eudyptes robustus]